MKSTKVQTLTAFATIDIIHNVQQHDYLCYMMYYTVHIHVHHHLCVSISAVAKALATAYAKEISNESCRQLSIKSTRYKEPFSIEQKHQSKLGVTERISIWRLTKNATKTTSHCFLTAFSLNKIVLQLFTHTIYRIASALSIAVLLHTKNAVFSENTW